VADRRVAMLQANAQDMAHGRTKGLSAAMLDRLALNALRVEAIEAGLRSVAAQPDPVGAVMPNGQRPNGLRIRGCARRSG
jgi:glutamate-5-semialdehyde dehydrogenase